jgi:hypothetical protein
LRDNVSTRFEIVGIALRAPIWDEGRAPWGSLSDLLGRSQSTTALSRHALIAAISGLTPMMFITRVML